MPSLYEELSKLEQTGGAGVLCTIVSTQGSTPRREGSKMLVFKDGSFIGTIGGGEMEHRVIEEALDALGESKPKLVSYRMVDPKRGDPGVCGGQLEIFIEPILPVRMMVVVGGGHVGRAVAHLASWLGFRTAICDDRQEIANPNSIPDADHFYYDPLLAISQEIEITPWTFFVLTTRSVDVDISILPAILESKSGYIGVIGSNRRWATTRKKLLEVGISEEKLDKVHSPIGLNIDAETPEEIAISIMAEIIKTINLGGNN
jgi:xanthine dehydrogenase accessory factor